MGMHFGVVATTGVGEKGKAGLLGRLFGRG